jgi:hypothetical protein
MLSATQVRKQERGVRFGIVTVTRDGTFRLERATRLAIQRYHEVAWGHKVIDLLCSQELSQDKGKAR